MQDELTLVDGHAQVIGWDGAPATLITLRRSLEAELRARQRVADSEPATRSGLAIGDLQAMLDRASDGAVTLDAQGTPNAVLIFQVGTTLTTGSNTSVSLINGAQACNVFWQIGSSATLGTGTRFVGTVMAAATITANTAATIHGRLFAQTGAVNLDTNTITKSTCAAGGGETTTATEATTLTQATALAEATALATTTATTPAAASGATAPTSTTPATVTGSKPATTSAAAREAAARKAAARKAARKAAAKKAARRRRARRAARIHRTQARPAAPHGRGSFTG